MFEKFENFLKLIDNEDKDIIITGDLNCNLIEHAQNHATSKLIDIIDIFQLQQHIQTPTRTTYNSSSLIDLILTHIDDDKILVFLLLLKNMRQLDNVELNVNINHG